MRFEYQISFKVQRSVAKIVNMQMCTVGYKYSLNNPVFPFPISLVPISRKRPLEIYSSKPPDFTLHDGPPYANGPIHFGHALNKILKDFTGRFQKLQGKNLSFIPGWDCHGLPIELSAVGENLSLSSEKIREASARRANICMQDQLAAFKQLNILSNWKASYSTLQPSYQATIIESFKDLFIKDFIVRDLKPVYWSSSTNCAISESELEYVPDHESISLYFLINIKNRPSFIPMSYQKYSLHVVVWTTTPWTIAANEAVLFNPDEFYAVLVDEQKKRLLIVSKRFSNTFPEILGNYVSNLSEVCCLRGVGFEGLSYHHPVRHNHTGDYQLRAADFVVEKGTGFVHCAPSHGRDDFAFAKRHGLPLCTIVDHIACFNEDAGMKLAGLPVQTEGNEAVIKLLGDSVVSIQKIRHNFPYEWRTKKPVITRLSEQWFINTDKLEHDAKKAYEKVNVFPPERKAMMYPFIEHRPFWCISRQRVWGVPIPVLYRNSDGSSIVDAIFISHIAQRVAERGSEFWWSESVKQLVPAAFLDKWGLDANEISKGMDIFDVWFESGLSWNAVLPKDCVADVYLEGLDQFRGWFSSSLLLSVALKGRAPFRSLVVHGFTTDSEGRKMSKSLGNVISPGSLLKSNNHCTDVLRRWAASSGLAARSSVGTKEFAAHTASYKKLRNMLRFMLGNTHDFSPFSESNQVDEVNSFLLLSCNQRDIFSTLDKWCLGQVGQFVDNAISHHFPNYKYEAIVAEGDQLVSRLSTTYFNAVKDTIYCDPPGSSERRSIQATLWLVTEALKACLAPILPDLTEEIESSQKLKTSSSHLDRLSHTYNNGKLSVGSLILQSSAKWASQWGPEVVKSVAIANQLRQCLSVLQHSSDGDGSAQLWPSPVSNPLARLHISIVLENLDDSVAFALQFLNCDSKSTGDSALCKILRCASVKTVDSKLNLEYLGMPVIISLASNTKVCCRLRVADQSTQCPRCRLYAASGVLGALCIRCASAIAPIADSTS